MSERKKRTQGDAGEHGFGAALVHRYAGPIRRYFDRRLNRVQDTEDLAQEVYLRLLRIDSAAKVQKPLQFIYGMARHVLLDHRAETAEKADFLQAARDSLNWTEYPSEALTERPEDRLSIEQQLNEILKVLPPLYSSILLLHERDGLSYEEIAAELNISIHTVKKYLTEARARVRMLFWDY